MNLSTKYLGLSLAHPLMAGASPLSHDLDSVRRLEDAGSSAIVLHSLFEEQIALEQLAAQKHLHGPSNSYVEAASYFPSTQVFALGVEAYLEHLQRVRAAVKVPVIASLNGTTAGGWLHYARQIQQAGASALELPLWPALWSAAELLMAPELARVRECESCSWLFLDTSRNHTRRWCSMEDCGNVAKARRHYARRHARG